MSRHEKVLCKDYKSFDSSSRFQISNSRLLVYPNPTSTQLNIKYKTDKDTKFEIVNILGQITATINLSKDALQVSVNISNLYAGVYMYRQTYEKEILNSGKLIIEK